MKKNQYQINKPLTEMINYSCIDQFGNPVPIQTLEVLPSDSFLCDSSSQYQVVDSMSNQKENNSFDFLQYLSNKDLKL